MKKLISLFLVIFTFNLNAADTTGISPDDLFALKNIYGNKMTGDGSKILYMQSHYEKESDTQYRYLYWLDVKTADLHKIHYDDNKISSPAWSADNQWIFFKSKHSDKDGNSKYQIFRTNLEGTLLSVITNSTKDINNFMIGNSGRYLYYTVSKTVNDKDKWANMRAEHSSVKYGHGIREVTQIFRHDLKTNKAVKLIDNNDVLWEYAISPDEKNIAMITTSDNEIIHFEGWSDLKIFNVDSKKTVTVPSKQYRKNAPSPYGYLEQLAWSTDNKRLAFSIGYDGYSPDIYLLTLKGEKITDLFPLIFQDDVTVKYSGLSWRGKTTDLCIKADKLARTRIYCINSIKKNRKAKLIEMTPGNKVIRGYSFSDDGKILSYCNAGINYYRDLFITDTENPTVEKRLTQANPQMESWPLPNIEIIKWQSPDGSSVEGILETPKNYKKSDGPLPLVVSIHGGPTYAENFSFASGSVHDGARTTFSSRGWAVLSPNYRGSTGFGNKFLTGLIGHKADSDIEDIMSGVDYLIKNKIADKNKMGIMGWSNGGYLTAMIIGITDRFKAASVGAGVFDIKMQWIIEDTPGHVLNFSQGFPWQNSAKLHKSSPISVVDKIKTPTLIHGGINDLRVPQEHSIGLYTSLKQYLNVPVELLLYSGEAHTINKIKHRRAKIEWEVKWFEHYILDKQI